MNIPPPKQQQQQSPEPPLCGGVKVTEMDETNKIIDESSTTSWEWNNDLLEDFNIEEQLNITWSPEYHHHHHHHQAIGPLPNHPYFEPITEHLSTQGLDGSDSRTQGNDPTLLSSDNILLAGIVPRSCTELEEEEEKVVEEGGGSGKGRARSTVSVSEANLCQVPGCEVDISELKGYNRRRRVCLRCANSTSVLFDGQTKRYCQQCGKFHNLPDFDEGKKSCRRKLERHNERRRRKLTGPRGIAEKDSQADMLSEYLACDDEAGKDNLPMSSHRLDEPLLESEDGHASPISSQDIRSDSVMSFAASGEPLEEQGKDKSICPTTSGDNRSAYSSVCPTGRISFKLYDWNPAEFPRRLRHQIFEWLATMPVEMEEYIRPGCTVLTAFIAMPQFMWEKVSEDAASYVHKFVSAPECLLFGRGTMTVYLNDMVFRVMKGGTSLTNVKVEMKAAPRLHYVHPTCFEAGKPMEFVACGSNLLQPKSWFLISFAGGYLPYNHRFSISHGKTGKTVSCHGNEVNNDQYYCCDHQIYKISIPKTEPKLFGSAFIEVENEFGLSNFIPILFGDRETCSELQMLQKKLDESLYSKKIHFGACDAISGSCKVFELRQKAKSELILDIAWLLKEPYMSEDDKPLSSKIPRLNCLLSFLIQNNSIIVLQRILQSLENVMDVEKSLDPANKANDVDMCLFHNYIVSARKIVHRTRDDIVQHPGSTSLEGDCFSQTHIGNDRIHVAASDNEDMAMGMEQSLGELQCQVMNREVKVLFHY